MAMSNKAKNVHGLPWFPENPARAHVMPKAISGFLYFLGFISLRARKQDSQTFGGD
jgi:hypothetical protein